MTDTDDAIMRRNEDAIKRRLLPELNEPFFILTTSDERDMRRACSHRNHGVRLEEPERAAFCRGCGAQVDAFDALVAYAKSERRLVQHAEAIAHHQKMEQARKDRQVTSRQFKRQVVKRTAVKDKTRKGDPITGYKMTLECGHVRAARKDQRDMAIATCYDCQVAETVP